MDWKTPFYWSTRFLLALYFGFYNRLSVRGPRRLPEGVPAIVIANHTSTLDPPLSAVVIKNRNLRFMAKKELWKNKLFAEAIEGWGAFPVDRSGQDSTAIRTAISCLKNREAILIFPEGTRSATGEIGPFQMGAVRLAATVPETVVVAVRFRGARESFGIGTKFPRPNKITATVSEPFRVDDLTAGSDDKKATYQKIHDRLVEMITSL